MAFYSKINEKIKVLLISQLIELLVDKFRFQG